MYRKMFLAKLNIFLIFILIIGYVNANSENRYLKYSPKEVASFQSEKSVIGIADNPSSIGLSSFMMSNLINQLRYPKQNLIGQRFGRLLVIDLLAIDKIYLKSGRNQYNYKWKCICDCGKEKISTTYALKQDDIKSCGCQRLKHTTNVVLNALVLAYKSQSKYRNLKFELTYEECEKLFSCECHYCGIEPMGTMKTGKHIMKFNGIDRVDSQKGYTIENVVTCCKICNVAKNNMLYEDFIKWVKNLCRNLLNKKLMTLDEKL